MVFLGGARWVVPGSPNLTFYDGSRKLKPPAFRLGNGAPELRGCIDPKVDGALAVRQGGIGSFAMGSTAGQLRNLRDERFILFAPVDNDLVLVH